jgi:hypothetical protein
MSTPQNPLFSILETIVLLRNEVNNSNNNVNQRLDALEECFVEINSRFEVIEAKIDSIRIPPSPTTSDDNLNDTIEPFGGENYEKPLRSLLSSHWKTANGSTRTPTQVNTAYDKIMGAAKSEVELVQPHMYKQGSTGRTWSFLKTTEQDRMVALVEDYAKQYGVYFRHCSGSWLVRRILIRRLLDKSRKDKM